MPAKTRRQVDEDEEDTEDEPTEADASPLTMAPLFDSEVAGDHIEEIQVFRLGPIHEGHLGELSPDATEADIRERWGGGKFQLKARNQKRKFIVGGFRTLAIAGDPIFESAESERKWRKMRGLAEPAAAVALALPAGDQFSAKDLFALMVQMQGNNQREADAAHQRQLQLMREDAARRENEARERERERDREREQNLQREREFFANLMKVNEAKQAQGDPMKTFFEAFRFIQEIKGESGGAEDPVSGLINRAPEIIDKAVSAFQAQKQIAAPAVPPPPVRRRLPPPKPAPAPVPKLPKGAIALTGISAEKMREFAKAAAAAGADPETVLVNVLDGIMKRKNTAAKTATAEPPAPPNSSPAPESVTA